MNQHFARFEARSSQFYIEAQARQVNLQPLVAADYLTYPNCVDYFMGKLLYHETVSEK